MEQGVGIVQIRNFFEDKQVLGSAFVFDPAHEIIYRCKTLELPWKDNKRRESCIPEGDYQVIKHVSPKFGPCFWVQDVPGRSEILWHPANWHSQLLGCCAPGSDFRDINNDGYRDVVNSRNTMEQLLSHLPNKFPLLIKNENL